MQLGKITLAAQPVLRCCVCASVQWLRLCRWLRPFRWRHMLRDAVCWQWRNTTRQHHSRDVPLGQQPKPFRIDHGGLYMLYIYKLIIYIHRSVSLSHAISSSPSLSLYLSLYLYMYINQSIFLYMYIHRFIYLSAYIYIYIYIHDAYTPKRGLSLSKHIYIYIYIYIYKYTNELITCLLPRTSAPGKCAAQGFYTHGNISI